MLIDLLLFAVGLTALIVGADLLVYGASRVASAAGVSPLVIGLTVVSLGTSAPEAAVSIEAAMSGSTDLALGNVVGSNIFNILLILGLTAVIAPITVNSQLIRQEVPIMIGVTLLLIALIADGGLSRPESAVLLALLVVYISFLVFQGKRKGKSLQADTESFVQASAEGGLSGMTHRLPAPLLILIGLALLVAGGHWLVTAATSIAREFGVSELIIGLTVVALGTSMPEVATSIAAVLRGERDIAIGNAVGSNLMNILGCLGAAGVVSANGLIAPSALLNFDIWVMLAAAVICVPIIITGKLISRSEGLLLLAYCFAYLTYTLLVATHHDALPAYSTAVIWVVGPLTALILIMSMIRQR